MRAEFVCLYSALDVVMSSERMDDRDDSKVLADFDLPREKADDLSKLEDDFMDLLFRVDTRDEDLNEKVQRADVCLS